jgi:hypothetical protein
LAASTKSAKKMYLHLTSLGVPQSASALGLHDHRD